MKRLFISRKLSPNSAFHTLDSKSWKIIDRALIKINCIDFKDEADTTWIFFYSKNGLKCYFDKRAFSESIKYAVMGQGTAAAFKDLIGIDPHFTGSGDPEQTAAEFERLSGNESVLFVKALNSKNSIYNLLSADTEKHLIDVYENKLEESFELESCDCLIFTSPLNAQAYFLKYPYDNELILSIGRTTAAYLKDAYGIDSYTPEETSEEGLFKLFMEKVKL